MTELDQVWSKMLDEAALNAAHSGRHDVAEYLRLKATNDAIRTAGVRWLFDTMTEIAGRDAHSPHGPTMERDEPHNFALGLSNMVGSRLQIRHGVRCLTVEAGWARTPSDGIMKKGSLAVARISHFGMSKATADLRLIRAETLPHWVGGDDQIVDSRELERHFDLFIGS